VETYQRDGEDDTSITYDITITAFVTGDDGATYDVSRSWTTLDVFQTHEEALYAALARAQEEKRNISLTIGAIGDAQGAGWVPQSNWET
jgi:hypothetical protein